MKQIEDIFSKNESKEKNRKSPNSKTPIIIDTREKQSLVASFLLEKNANIKFETLQIADYLIESSKNKQDKTIAIERKSYSDFISSMISKRLFIQLKELKKYPNNILIIEGRNMQYKEDEDNKIENKNLENAARGMILSIITEFQIPIIFTKDEEETSEFLLLLAKRQEKPSIEISLRPSKTLKTKQEKKQYILEGFPGIGPKTAKNLLKKFKSIKNIINSSEEELKEILRTKTQDFQNLLD